MHVVEIKGDRKVVCGCYKRLSGMLVFFVHLPLQAQVKELEVHHCSFLFGMVVNSARNIEETIMLVPQSMHQLDDLDTDRDGLDVKNRIFHCVSFRQKVPDMGRRG